VDSDQLTAFALLYIQLYSINVVFQAACKAG
jgi:hypothetical protein